MMFCDWVVVEGGGGGEYFVFLDVRIILFEGNISLCFLWDGFVFWLGSLLFGL